MNIVITQIKETYTPTNLTAQKAKQRRSEDARNLYKHDTIWFLMAVCEKMNRFKPRREQLVRHTSMLNYNTGKVSKCVCSGKKQ